MIDIIQYQRSVSNLSLGELLSCYLSRLMKQRDSQLTRKADNKIMSARF